ncbi:4-hydroxyphenylpyruvate dioxygenase-like protein [Synchiropus picturatus]
MAALLRQLHHITVHVSNVEKLKNDLISKFKFNFFASRVDDRCRQLAFKKGAAVFVVNERPCGLNEEVASAPGSQRMTARQSTQGKSVRCLYDVSPYYHVDTVCNVCFEVEDVERSFEALRNRGCSFLVPPTVVQDDDGHVTYSVLKSAVGNVCHTLIDKSKYNGRFLPGFTPEHCEQEEDNCPVTHFDHLTYCCPRNSSEEVIGWYQQMFGFQRFFLQRKEDVGEGLLIDQDGVGLRLKAMEYWKCSETGMALPSLSKTEPDCKFVIAESLPGQGSNQIDTFLQQHGASGIQHIALYTPSIISTAQTMVQSGVEFFFTPPAYYKEASKQQEIVEAGYSPHVLAQYGILLDTKLDQDSSNCDEKKKYLLQMFTKPIFAEDTFFLELIERQGATGFGEGNIKALWKAVNACMENAQGSECSVTSTP